MTSNTDTAKATLARMIRARVPVIGIETYEPRRVMDAIIGVIDSEEQRSQQSAVARGTQALPRKALYEFTVSRGLRRIATQSGEFMIPKGGNSSEQVQALPLDELEIFAASPDPAADVFNVFQHIIEAHRPRVEHGRPVIEPAVYVVKDVHGFLAHDGAALRSLRDAAEVLPRRYQTIILLSPSLAGLPAELRKDVRKLEWPLPDGEELRGKVAAFKTSRITVDLQPTEENKVVNALKGLGTVEADQVLASAGHIGFSQQRAQDTHPSVHRARSNQDLWHEQLAGFEILAYLIHPGNQAAVQNVAGPHALVQRLLNQCGHFGVIAIVQACSHFLQDVRHVSKPPQLVLA